MLDLGKESFLTFCFLNSLSLQVLHFLGYSHFSCFLLDNYQAWAIGLHDSGSRARRTCLLVPFIFAIVCWCCVLINSLISHRLVILLRRLHLRELIGVINLMRRLFQKSKWIYFFSIKYLNSACLLYEFSSQIEYFFNSCVVLLDLDFFGISPCLWFVCFIFVPFYVSKEIY